MKTRLAVAVMIGLFGATIPFARAFVPPTTEPLQNFDKREQTTIGKTASLSPGNAAAVTALKARVPQLKFRQDKTFGSVSYISAERGFLTGPGGKGGAVSADSLAAVSPDDPHRVVKAFLNENASLMGHDASVLGSAQVERDYVTKHNGLRTVVWQQRVQGVPVFDALMVGHLTKRGELVSLSDQFLSNPDRAAGAGTGQGATLPEHPKVAATKALALAASNLGVEVSEDDLMPNGASQGAVRGQRFNSPALSRPADLQLVWLPMNQSSMRLCWRVILPAGKLLEHYLVLIDSETGEALLRRSLTAHLSTASYNVFTNDSPSPFSPGWPTPDNGQPDLTSRSVVTYDTSALDTNASPAGWIRDGLAPPTLGNNADTFLCRLLNYDPITFAWVPDKPRPTGAGTNRVFDFPMNLTNNDPLVYADASTVQLFYRANWYHDRLYELGFTEAAGNFQTTNFGRGGFDGDPVLALVQAGADRGYSDNAMFYTPPDGISGECYMFVFTGPTPSRDGSLDQEVVVHELTHGLSNRLLGGGVGISALQTEGMGEGWSDFYALCLLSEETDDPDACYATGGYASYLLGGFSFRQNYYFGIRRYPYSTDMSKNPLTFKDIDPSQASSHVGVPINPIFGGSNPAEVHNQGEVWCMTLREVWAGLVKEWGWSVGNQLALQLVTDGLKLAPANANFLEARDGILLADEIDNGGENSAILWAAFAKRGMGFSASCPDSDTTTGVGEAYDGPVADGLLEVGVRPTPWSTVFTGDIVTNYLRITDASAVTNATVSGRIVGSTNLLYLNNGTGADRRANDATYTTTFKAPSSPGTLAIEVAISAPGKVSTTNTFSYFVISTPLNDNFANATKVPSAGSNYVTSNLRATREVGEPSHAGLSSPASLWWNYTATTTTNVLVDTGGSDFVSVVAVYTNNTLSSLMPVTSAVGSAARLGAYVYFTAQAGVAYRIAVAGSDSKNIGTVMLEVRPGGLADTNAPIVSITSPINGAAVVTNRIALGGTAVDQGATPAGIKSITYRVSAIAGYTTSQTLPWEDSFIGVLNTNWNGLVGLFEGLNNVEVDVADFAGNIGTASIQVTYRPLDPPNDYFANATVLTNYSGVYNINTIKATKEAGEPDHAGNSGGHSAWWSFTPTVDGVLALSTTNSTFDTLLAIYSGTSIANLTPVASNDDAYESAFNGFSQIIQGLHAGQTYRIAVDGYDGLAGAVFLTYNFTPSPIYHVTVTNTLGGLATPGSADVWSNGVVVVSASPNAGYQFDMWDGDVVSLSNPLAVTVRGNLSILARFIPIEYTDGFESGNFTHVGWTFGGNKSWIVQTNVAAAGNYAARSGVIGNSQTSSLILASSFRAGYGSFSYRVSSEAGYDYLRFYLDGALIQQWSGNVGWSGFSFPLTAGAHTLEWRYAKDASGSAGLDAAYIDNVNVPMVIGTNASSVAHLNIQTQTDGGYFVSFMAQTNQQYILQGSTNLINWQGISTNVATGGFLRYPISITTSNRMLFYRAVAAPN